MCAPVSPAALTISSAPSINPSGRNSARSLVCVKTGAPADAASAATRRYSAGGTPGA